MEKIREGGRGTKKQNRGQETKNTKTRLRREVERNKYKKKESKAKQRNKDQQMTLGAGGSSGGQPGMQLRDSRKLGTGVDPGNLETGG